MTDEAPGGSTGRGVEPGILLKGIFSGFLYFLCLSFFSSKTQDRKWRGEKKKIIHSDKHSGLLLFPK